MYYNITFLKRQLSHDKNVSVKSQQEALLAGCWYVLPSPYSHINYHISLGISLKAHRSF